MTEKACLVLVELLDPGTFAEYHMFITAAAAALQKSIDIYDDMDITCNPDLSRCKYVWIRRLERWKSDDFERMFLITKNKQENIDAWTLILDLNNLARTDPAAMQMWSASDAFIMYIAGGGWNEWKSLLTLLNDYPLPSKGNPPYAWKVDMTHVLLSISQNGQVDDHPAVLDLLYNWLANTPRLMYEAGHEERYLFGIVQVIFGRKPPMENRASHMKYFSGLPSRGLWFQRALVVCRDPDDFKEKEVIPFLKDEEQKNVISACLMNTLVPTLIANAEFDPLPEMNGLQELAQLCCGSDDKLMGDIRNLIKFDPSYRRRVDPLWCYGSMMTDDYLSPNEFVTADDFLTCWKVAPDYWPKHLSRDLSQLARRLSQTNKRLFSTDESYKSHVAFLGKVSEIGYDRNTGPALGRYLDHLVFKLPDETDVETFGHPEAIWLLCVKYPNELGRLVPVILWILRRSPEKFLEDKKWATSVAAMFNAFVQADEYPHDIGTWSVPTELMVRFLKANANLSLPKETKEYILQNIGKVKPGDLTEDHTELENQLKKMK